MEKFHEVDVELQNSFGICMPYRHLSRAVLFIIILVASFIMFLLGITYHYLSYLEFPAYQIYFICLAISLSNYGLYAVFLQFKWSCQHLYRRFYYVNMLIQQLQFDRPMSDYCTLNEPKPIGNRHLVKEYGLWNPLANPTPNMAYIKPPSESGKGKGKGHNLNLNLNQMTVRQILVQDNNKIRNENEVKKYGLAFLNILLHEKM